MIISVLNVKIIAITVQNALTNKQEIWKIHVYAKLGIWKLINKLNVKNVIQNAVLALVQVIIVLTVQTVWEKRPQSVAVFKGIMRIYKLITVKNVNMIVFVYNLKFV